MAMLWGAMDGEVSKRFMSPAMRDHINQAYIPTHPEIAQPIKKTLLNIYRIQDTLMIDKLPDINNDPTVPPAVVPVGQQPESTDSRVQQYL
jgi:hypothetical protein